MMIENISVTKCLSSLARLREQNKIHLKKEAKYKLNRGLLSIEPTRTFMEGKTIKN